MLKNKKTFIALLTVFVVLLLDQCLKIYIKTHYRIGDETQITSWFHLHFIENEGMAFGLKLAGSSGKLILTLFRIVAVSFIGYYVSRLIKTNQHIGFIICMSMILAGALGNILDSVFYGVIFNDSSYHHLATLFPKEGGYAPWLHGKVVDMLWFPLWEGILPKVVPIWGGEYVSFFDPVFNLADSSITIGVIAILIFQKLFFKENNTQEELTSENQSETINEFETHIEYEPKK